MARDQSIINAPGGPTRPKLVIRRDELLRTLAATVQDDVALILLQAPAGFGKTTVLRHWAVEDARDFIWVRQRGVGADLDRLLVSIDLARRRALGSVGARPAAPSSTAALSSVIETLRTPSRNYVLVLDGPQGLANPSGAALIHALAAALPPGCQLVITSRGRLDPGLAALPSGRRTLNLGPDHLAFAPEETREALAVAGLQGSEDLVRRFIQGTEGWPAGIGLAVQSLHQSSKARGPERTDLRIDNLRTVEYFRDEVLDRQSPETRRFLLRTSVLDELSGPLCDAVLATTGSAATLEEMHTRNLFIRVEEADPLRYRYHRLFATVLRSELRRRHPDEERTLRRRAALWFEHHGQPEQAIEQAIAADDVPTAARLICSCAAALVEDGRLETVLSWLQALGERAAQLYPPLGVTGAWIWALTGDVPRALRSTLAAERGSFEGVSPDGTTSIASGVAMVRAAMAPLGIQQMLTDAERAFELEPAHAPWYPNAVLLLANARLMNGDTAGAVTAFEKSLNLNRPTHPTGVQFALAQLALIAAWQQDWARAEQQAAEAVALMRATDERDQLASVLTHVASAAVATHRADRPTAHRAIDQAARLYTERTPAGFPWFAGQAAIAIGRLLLALGDVPQAHLMADTAREQVNRLLTEGILGEHLRILEEELVALGPDGPLEPLSVAELRVLELLSTHLRLGEIGEELHLSRNTVKSHVAAIHRKLACSTRAEAVRRARKLGLIEV